MKENEIEKAEKLTKFLGGDSEHLDPKETNFLEEDLNIYQTIWEDLGDIPRPEPTESMDIKFQAMLSGYKTARTKRPRILDVLGSYFQVHWQPALVMLIVGLGIGYLTSSRSNEEIKEMASELDDMKKMMLYSMIEQPKANDRIKAVNLTKELTTIDDQMIAVLKSTLIEDENINVRISAIETLTKYWENPRARMALVESIQFQSSPLVQSAIADAIVSLREKSAINEIEKLLQKEDINEGVKVKLENTIDHLKSI